MDPLSKFNHFIAYFVPGAVLLVAVLMFLSSIYGKNFLSSMLMVDGFVRVSILIIAVTILGVFVDELRHTKIEAYLEQEWAKKKSYDLNKIDDYIAYAPKIGIEVYKTIVDEYYYFYEFDINTAICMIVLACASPIYFSTFQYVGIDSANSIGILVGVVACLFGYFGVDCYRYFLDTIISTMEKVENGFRDSIIKK